MYEKLSFFWGLFFPLIFFFISGAMSGLRKSFSVNVVWTAPRLQSLEAIFARSMLTQIFWALLLKLFRWHTVSASVENNEKYWVRNSTTRLALNENDFCWRIARSCWVHALNLIPIENILIEIFGASHLQNLVVAENWSKSFDFALPSSPSPEQMKECALKSSPGWAVSLNLLKQICILFKKSLNEYKSERLSFLASYTRTRIYVVLRTID